MRWCVYYIYKKSQRFFQRLLRGWDDSEVVMLDWSLYQWLLPRLKRYYELNTDLSPYGKSYNEWHTELEHGISLLETVLEHDDDLQREEFNMWLMKNLNYLR